MTEDGKENERERRARSTRTDETRGMLDEFCPRGGETRPEMTDVCENQDGAKVAPNMEAGGSHHQATLSPGFEERVKERQKLNAARDVRVPCRFLLEQQGR